MAILGLLLLIGAGFALSGLVASPPGEAGARIDGTEDDDALFGTDGNDTIRAFGGDDFVNGLGGDDLIDFGAANDDGTGGDGNDTLFGGTGNDLVVGGAGDDRVFLGDGNDASFNVVDLDPALDSGNDFVRGGAGNDLIIDTAGSDTLYGDTGDDRLDARDVTDPAGNPDLLFGGFGNDALIGDAGDTMTGGTGADVFAAVLTAGGIPITVTDFDDLDRLEFIYPEGDPRPVVTLEQRGPDMLVLLDDQIAAIRERIPPEAIGPGQIALVAGRL
ncbi:MAG: calcium-binding protein [Gemmobacter sp.]